MGEDGGMRILFSTAPGVGHLLPLLPLARAARDLGHEVVVAGGSSLGSIITEAGFRHEPIGPATIGEMFRGLPDVSGLPARERVLVTMPHVFCEGLAPAIARGLVGLLGRWRADVVVHEDMDFGSGLVAEREDIPHVTVQATAWRPTIQSIAMAALEPLRDRLGVAREHRPAGLFGELFFTTRPRSLRDAEAPLPAASAELRPIADDRLDPRDSPAEDPYGPADGRPRVAITLGTVNNAQVELLRTLIDGAVAAGSQVVVALGADPGSLGPVPPGVGVHAYVPMSQLLPASDVVVHHGGSGTMLAALAAGTPMVMVPLAADQPDNGDRCEAAGVARILTPAGIDASIVRAAIEAVLTEPDHRRRSLEVAAEIAAMPGPEVALGRIEEIARRR
jgi:UDP:flavonoid glycosyltransferase YjiC (YdhE family)